MDKVINYDWMKELSAFDKQSAPQKQENDSKIEWLNVNKAYKKNISFKVMPANSKENGIFAFVVGTHWNLGPDNMRFVCPEQTLHLRHNEVKCPICEAKRRLKAMGFTDEELSTEGKFGPISVFDPKITSNIKVVALESDMQTFDKKHISILQQNGSYTARWLAEKYNSPDVPNFLALEESNPIKFSRDRDNGKWEREFSFITCKFDEVALQTLKEENEALTMQDLWKMPSDEEILKANEIAEKMVNSYIESKKQVEEAASDTYNGDHMPF